MTHRDVVEVIPSIADLYSELANPFTDELDRHYLGDSNVETWSVGMTRTLDFRADNEDRFYDIDFRQMQSEPIETVRSLYAWLGARSAPSSRSRHAAVVADLGGQPGSRSTGRDRKAFGIDVDALGSLSPGTRSASQHR